MAWSSILGAVAGAGGSMLGDVVSNAYGQHNARVAFRRQKTIMKNMIQWRVKDLLAAGLNPMLATGAGVGGQSASVQQAQGQEFDPAAAAIRGAEAVMNTRTGNADIAQTNAGTAKAIAETQNVPKLGEMIDAQKQHYLEQINTEREHQGYFRASAGQAAASAAATKEGLPSQIQERLSRADRERAEASRTRAGGTSQIPEPIRERVGSTAQDWWEAYKRFAGPGGPEEKVLNRISQGLRSAARGVAGFFTPENPGTSTPGPRGLR